MKNKMEQKVEGKKTKSIDYDKLHLTLQNKLLSLTGKKQFMVGGKYAFLNNKLDFTNKLKGVISKYKLKDFNKLEKLFHSTLQDFASKACVFKFFMPFPFGKKAIALNDHGLRCLLQKFGCHRLIELVVVLMSLDMNIVSLQNEL